MSANKTDLFADDWQSQDELINRMKTETNVLETPRIKQAFQRVDRKDFVRPDYSVEAYEDYPLPIGQDQTISQPTTVAYMLELLAPETGENVLDVGCGSGWTTALLADIVQDSGHVVGVEIIDELAEFATKNVAKYDFEHATVRQANAMEDTQPEAPFDKILASAAAPKIPDMLTRQLADDGVLVMPVGNEVVRLHKNSDGTYDREEFQGFRFVPMQGIE